MRKPPKYSHHKPSGQARVWIAGRRYYLGKYGSPESWQKYHALIAEYMATGGARNPSPAAAPLTLAELAERYLAAAGRKYRSNHIAKIKATLGVVLSMFGPMKATEFGPSKLRAVQSHLRAKGYHPATVNQRAMMLRKMFRWGVAWELVPPEIGHALREVENLPTPKPEARPANDAHVAAALGHMPPTVSAMVQLQRLTGMRPGEVCSLRGVDIEKDSPIPGIWTYRPADHKTAHLGLKREILISPEAQALLLPWLEATVGDAHVFRPADALPWHPKKRRKRPIGVRYAPEAYAKAVWRACEAAGVPHWSPNQLRHAAGTEFEATMGARTAGQLLGHRSLTTTRRYVKTDLVDAAEALLKKKKPA